MIIGLDVGGTHTDVVLLGDEGLISEIKVPTEPDHLFNSVLSGLEKATAGIDPQKIKRVVLSTTLTTNAIAQNKLPPVGMLVSAGPGIDPESFSTNRHFRVVPGAIDHRGREIKPVDIEAVKSIAGEFETEGIQHIGIVGKFSVRNPEHELTIREVIKKSFAHVFVGHQISGALNFPRRIATTFLNAAVYPIHRKFYEAVRRSLEARGLNLPIRILKADGGNMQFDASIDFPVQTILSGPAASVMGSIAFAPEHEDCLVMDIGGTTTDMAIFVDRAPLLDPLGGTLGLYKTLIRSLDTHSIALGGDSAVTLENGDLKVGPERRGPAMAYGGPAPTPTDALFVLEDIPDGDRKRALQGIASLAQALGMPLEDTARAVFARTCDQILNEARQMVKRVNRKPVYTVHELLEGYIVNPKKLLVLGGPAPYFARQFKRASEWDIRVVPRWTVANAIGAGLARTTCEVTLFADTQKGIVIAPEENFSNKISGRFSDADAVRIAFKLLKRKALRRGANPKHLEMEMIEHMQFNMIRGFNTTGKNIRIRVQVKPGLIHGQNRLIEKISQGG